MTRPKPPQDLEVKPSENEIILATWKPPVEVPKNNSIAYYNVYVSACTESTNCKDGMLNF